MDKAIVNWLDQAVERDQGEAFRAALKKWLPRIDDAYAEGRKVRGHLGASTIGSPCARQVWYGFRWASGTFRRFSGRMLRLFNRGHLEEARFLALLEAAGAEVWAANNDGSQFRVVIDGNKLFGGSVDAVVRGVPGYGQEAMLAEFKTHNRKSFDKLVKSGVHAAKPEHWAQMQTYMYGLGFSKALYLAVCKDDDSLYAKVIHYSVEAAERLLERANDIILLNDPPPRINNDPCWYMCKWCCHADICHNSVSPKRTCRSCEHVDFIPDGTVWCKSKAKALSLDEQLKACSFYSLNQTF